ncbi:hypothetical protein VBP81_003450 [Vibrio fluvialis]|nr:hypothetical protein [Vibrio fluvialis]
MLEAFFLIWGISVLVSSRKVLSTAPQVKSWMKQINDSVGAGIIALALYSPSEAIKVLERFFMYAGLILLGIMVVCQSYLVWLHPLLIILSVMLLYTSISLSFWTKQRGKITNDIVREYKKTLKSTIKWMIAAFTLFFVGFSAFQLHLDPSFVPDIKELFYLIVAAVITVTLSLGVMNVLFYLLLFLPAILTILYVGLVVYLTRALYKVGKNKLLYTFDIFSVLVGPLVSVYLTYDSVKYSL